MFSNIKIRILDHRCTIPDTGSSLCRERRASRPRRGRELSGRGDSAGSAPAQRAPNTHIFYFFLWAQNFLSIYIINCTFAKVESELFLYKVWRRTRGPTCYERNWYIFWSYYKMDYILILDRTTMFWSGNSFVFGLRAVLFWCVRSFTSLASRKGEVIFLDIFTSVFLSEV